MQKSYVPYNTVFCTILTDSKSMSHELQKKSSQTAKGFEKFATELDLLNQEIADLKEQVYSCNAQEIRLISGFDEMVVYYNDVAESRFKHISKEIKQLRETRIKALEELAKMQAKRYEFQAKCEIIACRQGELLWGRRLEDVKKRKWKPAA